MERSPCCNTAHCDINSLSVVYLDNVYQCLLYWRFLMNWFQDAYCCPETSSREIIIDIMHNIVMWHLGECTSVSYVFGA